MCALKGKKSIWLPVFHLIFVRCSLKQSLAFMLKQNQRMYLHINCSMHNKRKKILTHSLSFSRYHASFTYAYYTKSFYVYI